MPFERPPPPPFTPVNWYWVVAGSSSQVYSSTAGDYVTVDDATYQAWLAAGNKSTQIDTEANLAAVLAPYALRPVNANVLDNFKQALANNVGAQVIFKILFDHENRIRALEGKAAITVQQAIAGIKALM